MRPTTSCLLSAAVAACVSIGVVPEAFAAGVAAPGSGALSATVVGGRRAALGDARGGYARRGSGRCGLGRCGLPVYAGYGYGFGYGDYGYGFVDGYRFDPRLLRGDLPNERESAVPAVAGIPAPPVAPPAIYVIGDERSTARGRVSRRAEPSVVTVR